MRAFWLADVLRAAGLTVIELEGWRERGRELTEIRGVVLHDTVTTVAWPDERVDRLLRDGRPDLAGPLAQLGLDRQGRFRLVAAGRANHNGYGEWGNQALGIEVYAAGGLAGHEETWNPAQFDAATRGTAAILNHLGLPASRTKGHRETNPERKIDPWHVDLDELRRRIEQGDDDMTDAERQMLTEVRDRLRALHIGNYVGDGTVDGQGDLTWLAQKLEPLEQRLAAIEAKLD